jgi:hypothetical protein
MFFRIDRLQVELPTATRVDPNEQMQSHPIAVSQGEKNVNPSPGEGHHVYRSW